MNRSKKKKKSERQQYVGTAFAMLIGAIFGVLLAPRLEIFTFGASLHQIILSVDEYRAERTRNIPSTP